VNGAGGHRMRFIPRVSDRTECGGVYISANTITQSAEELISSTPNIGTKNRIKIELFIKMESKSNPKEKPQSSHC